MVLCYKGYKYWYLKAGWRKWFYRGDLLKSYTVFPLQASREHQENLKIFLGYWEKRLGTKGESNSHFNNYFLFLCGRMDQVVFQIFANSLGKVWIKII